MTVSTPKSLRRHDTARARRARIARRVAAVAGAAGAAVVGEADAAPITYVPTPGVAAAQGIPGFSFVSASNVTLGALRPPAVDFTSTSWNVDGGSGSAFKLRNWSNEAFFDATIGASLATYQGVEAQKSLLNLAGGVVVGNLLNFANDNGVIIMTMFGNDYQPQFATSVSGQFGFRFTSGTSTLYGWGSLVIDEFAQGEGFKITEAYYQTNGGSINVGAVPVPEPSSMALLGIGAAGVAAWRARRKSRAEA